MAEQTPSVPVDEQTATPMPTQRQAGEYDAKAYADSFGAGDDTEARLVQAARAYAADLENSRRVPMENDPRRPLTAEDVPAPRGFYGISSTYIQYPKDVMASSVGRMVTSYTMDSTAVTADAQGNKLVYEGTTLQLSGTKVAPRTSGTCVGVLAQRVNLRDADEDIALIIGGVVNASKCWDNGVFAPTAATLTALTFAPLCKNLAFSDFDI
jgi:hypothetical protein